jgi:hypothetical protein
VNQWSGVVLLKTRYVGLHHLFFTSALDRWLNDGFNIQALVKIKRKNSQNLQQPNDPDRSVSSAPPELIRQTSRFFLVTLSFLHRHSFNVAQGWPW